MERGRRDKGERARRERETIGYEPMSQQVTSPWRVEREAAGYEFVVRGERDNRFRARGACCVCDSSVDPGGETVGFIWEHDIILCVIQGFQ